MNPTATPQKRSGKGGKHRPRRRIRPWRSLLGGLGLLLVLVLGFATWLTTTTSGVSWLLGQVGLPEGLTLERVEGSLVRGLVLHELSFRNESLEAASPRVEARVGFGWGDRGVQIHELRVVDLETRLAGGGDDTPLDLEAVLAEAALPLPVHVHSLVVDGGRVAREGGEWSFDRLQAEGRWFTALEDLDLQLAAPDLDAGLAGELALAQGRTDLALTARADASRWSDFLPSDLVLDARARDRLDTLDIALHSAVLGLEADGRLDDPAGTPRVVLDVQMERWQAPGPSEAPLVVSGVTGAVDATLERYRLDLDGRLDQGEWTDVRWSLRGDGDLDGIDLERFEAQAEVGEVAAGGEVHWAGETHRVDLEIDWRDLRWPPGGELLASSPTGQGRVSGTLEDWAFEGGFALETPEHPGGTFTLQARGDLDSARVESLEGQALGGRLDASADIDWSGDPKASGQFDLVSMDLGDLLPEWPAVIDARGRFTASGGETPALDLDFDDLGGTFRGEPIDGGGQLALHGPRWNAESLRLALGPSSVFLDGSIDTAGRTGMEARFRADLDVRRPGWVADWLGGEVQGELEVDSSADFPLLTADLRVSDLDRPGLSIDQLLVQRAPGAPSRVEVEAAQLVIGDTPVHGLSGVLMGEGDAWTLSFRGGSGTLWLEMALAGNLAFGATPTDFAWNGELTSLVLTQAERDEILARLQAPAPLSLATDRYAVTDACLLGPENGLACVSAEGVPGESIDAGARFESLSLALLQRSFDAGLDSTQRLQGEAGWKWRRGADPSGFAAIEISAGEIGRVGDEDLKVATEPGFLGFQLEAGNLEGGRVDLPLAEAGHLRVNFRIAGLHFDGTGQVSGEMDLDLHTLAFLDAFVTQAEDFGGTLRAQLTLGGTTADPSFEGYFDLSDGTVTVPMLGARFEELGLRGRVSGEDEVRLGGRFRAGEGEGRLGLRAHLQDLSDPRFELRLEGERLAAARLPDLELDVDPDLRLAWSGGTWNLDGTLAIPRGVIRPLTSFVSRVDESPDVVVVAGERRPVLAAEEERPARFDGALQVTLGQGVRLEMDIASLALGGGMDLAWDGALVPTATGEVSVNGNVSAWGPRLLINGGRVIWRGGSVENPTLDLRAERDVFGNTLVRTAGVRVSGTAKNPDVEAFTRPLTTSERAWGVLLTGSDVNFAQGVGALDVGTYIAPRIFLSYGISLFDSDNVVGIRYDLKRGWGVKATSGQRESGIDLSYTIESD